MVWVVGFTAQNTLQKKLIRRRTSRLTIEIDFFESSYTHLAGSEYIICVLGLILGSIELFGRGLVKMIPINAGLSTFLFVIQVN